LNAPRDPHALADHWLEMARDAAAAARPGIAVATTAIAVLVVVVVGARRRHRREAVRNARVLRIGVPVTVERDGAPLLWAALHDRLRPPISRLLFGQPHVGWEVDASSAGIGFQLWLPAKTPPGLAEGALAAAWPGVTVSPIPCDASAPEAPTSVTELVLAGPQWFSLNHANAPDPLRLLLAQVARTSGTESVFIQMLVQPAPTRERLRGAAEALRIRSGSAARSGRFARLISVQNSAAKRDPVASRDARAALEKSSHPLYRVLIRVAVTAPDRKQARGLIDAACGAFAAYEGQARFRRRRTRISGRHLRDRVLTRRASLLSLPELAALAHLPTEPIAGVERATARTLLPPRHLSRTGKPLGHASDGTPVTLDIADARHHLHLLGPTGVGKSTLIAQLALSDVTAGRGAVVIDPKGDLVEDILRTVPPGYEDRVDVLDPLDSAPPGLNVLEGDDPDLITDHLVGIFSRVYERHWGPRTDDVMRGAVLTLLSSQRPATLVDVPRLLTDNRYRSRFLAELDDPVGLEPFWDSYESLAEATRAQAIAPLLNKLRAFLLRRPVRAIVGQLQSTVDVAGCLDSGRLLLARLPKGTLGEDTSRLLGSFLVARVWQAALARSALPQDARRDCTLYVDEVQSYLTLPSPLADMLAEARGYRLSICLAHQHLSQLPRDMREAIAANARTKIYFQLSQQDAASVTREFEPDLAAHDLANLPRHTAAVRLWSRGELTRPFTLTTEALECGSAERAAAIRDRSRHRIGADRDAIEAQLAHRAFAHADRLPTASERP
jgi:hypothetical protein